MIESFIACFLVLICASISYIIKIEHRLSKIETKVCLILNYWKNNTGEKNEKEKMG